MKQFRKESANFRKPQVDVKMLKEMGHLDAIPGIDGAVLTKKYKLEMAT